MIFFERGQTGVKEIGVYFKIHYSVVSRIIAASKKTRWCKM